MKIEIWSDVMCPFCYIGKRRFEEALRAFPQKEAIDVTWKSFQLNPYLQKNTGQNINEYLAENKGISLQQAREMNDRVTRMAAEVGLTYDFEKAVVAPSFDAHRLSHLAAAHGMGDAAEEALFKAYFTEGRDISDKSTLVELGTEIGLDPGEVRTALDTDAYAVAVRADLAEAAELGARGVPFFVFDRKYAVSGAQQPEVFTGALTQAYNDGVTDGAVCGPDGSCD
jgi:predicted DsbA family dithiol-disulfide isomerase